MAAGYILVRDEARPIADECVRCPSGSYSTEKATYPDARSPGALFVSDSSAALSLCVDCNWLKSSCAGGADVTPAAGYWRPPNQNGTKRRATGISGSSGNQTLEVELITCNPAERCLEGGTCVKGMRGPVCGLCEDDFAMGSKELCIPCPKSKSMAFQIGGVAVSFFVFCVAYYLILLRPLLSEDSQPDDDDKGNPMDTRAMRACYGAGLWNWCMSIGSVKLALGPFRYVYKRLVELLVWIVASFLKNSGAEIIKVLISFMQVSGSFLSSYSIKVGVWHGGTISRYCRCDVRERIYASCAARVQPRTTRSCPWTDARAHTHTHTHTHTHSGHPQSRVC